MSYSPNFVRRVGTATITITPANPILAGGIISVRFPQKWNFILSNDSTINTTTLTCNIVNNSISSLISCGLTSSLSDLLVNFTSPFSTVLNNSFSVTVNPVLSVPLSYNSNEVWVMTQDSSGNTIDQATNCSTSAPNPNTFTMTTTAIASVSKSFAPNMTFRATDIVNTNDTVRVTLPSEISFLNASLSMFLNDSGQTINKITTFDSTNSNTSSYSYNIGTFSLGTRTYANSNTSLTFYNILMMAPPTSKPSGNIVVSLFRSGAIYSTGTLSITALTGSLTGVALSAQTATINRQTTYNISLVLASPLSSTGQVTIQLPTSISASDYSAKSCVVSGSTNISSSAMCTMSSKVLTVTNAFTGLFAASSAFSVSFDGVTNPESTSTTAVFRINTFYDTSTAPTFPVDTSSSVTFTATADTVVSFTVTPGSFVVNAVAVYTIVYKLSNHLPIGGTVLIGLPLGMTLQNPGSATVMVSINSSTAASNTPTIVSTSNGVYSSALNFSGLASSSALAAGTTITFQVSSLINPGSTKPSNSFSVYSHLMGFLI